MLIIDKIDSIRRKMACQCGCESAPVDIQLFDIFLYLEALTEVVIVSGYRCIEHNRNEGGVDGSYHTKGTAFDLEFKDVDFGLKLMAAHIKQNSIDYIDYYQYTDNRVHIEIDVRKFLNFA